MYSYSPFRSGYSTPDKDAPCVFCDPVVIQKQTIVLADNKAVENKYYRWIVNTYPKFEGHTMLVPKRHITSIEDEQPEETLACADLLKVALKAMRILFPTSGIEYFAQWGAQSASSQAHIHTHLVPANPEDPFRSFEKLGHFYTTKDQQEKIVLFPTTIKLSPEELLAEFKKIQFK